MDSFIHSSMEDSQNFSSFKVLMFPWLAHGHISPFIELSRTLLTSKNCHIYFCSTKINLSFIKNNFEDIFFSNHSFELVELHLPDSPELPPQYHTTKNLPPHLMKNLMQAFQMGKSSFSTILNEVNPDLLIFDGFQSWASNLAAEKGIPSVHFITSGAATMSFFYHMYKDSGFGGFPFPSIFLRDYEKRKLQVLMESNKPVGEDFAFRCLEVSTEIILIKTCKELEKKYLDHLSFLCGKELVPLGPLLQEPNNQERDEHNTQIINFLNGKPHSSVVFVSFGSEYFLSEEEREEIANGLELSNVGFIWVVRFPEGEEKLSIEEAVPKGFFNRVKNRGIVVDGWAPQAQILEHKSTGGFVSHCGWSSVMESLCFGVPIIAMPMHLDQPTNARLLGEIGVGLEVLRDENGMMNREIIAEAIKMVVLEKSGEEIRGKAKILSEKLRLNGKREEQEAAEKVWNLCSKYKQARK